MGVDHQQARLSLEDGDVDVVPLVARHPHALTHLCELRHEREPTAGRVSLPMPHVRGKGSRTRSGPRLVRRALLRAAHGHIAAEVAVAHPRLPPPPCWARLAGHALLGTPPDVAREGQGLADIAE